MGHHERKQFARCMEAATKLATMGEPGVDRRSHLQPLLIPLSALVGLIDSRIS